MIKMYGFWRSAAAFRVRIAMNLKGVEFTETMIDLDAGEQHAPDYVELNPQAVVPSLILDDGTMLSQSMAILEYLEETHPTPALLPSDPLGRARVRATFLSSSTSHRSFTVHPKPLSRNAPAPKSASSFASGKQPAGAAMASDQ